MKSPNLIPLLLLSLLVVGCQDKPADVPPATASATSGSSTEQPPKQAEAAPPVLPDELKSEAYRWYGLGNTKPMKIEIDITGRSPAESEQTIRLVEVKDGKAKYEINRGDQLGTDSVSLEKDGIYTVGSTLIHGGTRNLDMPSNVPPGAKWTNHGKVDMTSPTGADSKVNQDLAIRVIGMTEVATKAGKQQALHMKESGTLVVDGVRYRMDSDVYYVKDKGLVKSVATMRDASKPKETPRVITIQETK